MPPRPAIVAIVPLPPPYLLPHNLLRPRTHLPSQLRQFGIKSIDPPAPSRFNNVGSGLAPLLSSSTAALERHAKANTLPLRPGALAIKKGMTAIYDTETGKRTPCTVLQLDQVQVVGHKTRKKHGYYAVCVGSGSKAAKNVTKPMLGHFSVQGVSPKRHLHEFRVADHSGLLAVGEEIKADWFMEGQYVDTRANCKGKGFQGVMKRWGMHGQDRSHGASLSHRSMGSAGQGQGGGSRVHPGKKMAGNMGGQRNTVQSLKVLQTDRERGLVVVNGAVSGPKGCLVMISDAIKKPWPQVPPPPKPAEINKEMGESITAKVGT
jgi:large subunit ribosomal protein L3